MKKNLMMIGIAVAALLLATENVQAQSRETRGTRTERRNERIIRQEDPRRSERGRVIIQGPARRVKVVDHEVIRAFDRESFDSNRLKMADMVFSTGGFMTAAQIRDVSAMFDFDSNRIKFLKKAWLNCVDRYNFYRVLETLEFSSSRDKIIKYIMDTPIDDPRDLEPIHKVNNAEMNAIIKMLKKEDFDSTREKLAKMIVSGSMLTSRQIADMARTFDFDSNRYEFLLYAYRSSVDPQNYVIAANTLEFSTNRNDLMRKITRRP
jgi:hypothetical protein